MMALVSLNPVTQYATDANLKARQRLWEFQQPRFDLVGWTLQLAGLESSRGQRVLDVGCGNGSYLRELRRRGISAIGCDLSMGMLDTAAEPMLVNADVMCLPLPDDGFDVVLAPHMLYHVPDRIAAAAELRRVLKPGGLCVAVTNGDRHMRALRALVERAVRVATPTWEMRSPATHAFSLNNGEAQLRTAFAAVACIRAEGSAPVTITDASLAADYIASVADHYQHETDRPWSEVVDDVRAAVQASIDEHGDFVITGEVGAFVCS